MMRLILLSCAIGLVLSPRPVDSQTTVGGARVTGRVIDADLKTPIAGARVMLMPVMQRVDPARGRPVVPSMPTMPVTTVSDDNGRFAFEGVAPGAFRVSVQKQGFALDLHDPQTVDVRTDQPTTVAVFMRRGGVLTGRILDERGEPLSDIRVSAMRRLEGRGDRLTMAGGPGSATNDLGEFRIASLPAGEYVLMATSQPSTPFGGSSPGASTAWAPTYYPGTTNQAEAQVVTLPQADTVSGLEFRLISAPAFRVAGIVLDEAGKPVADAIVTLNPRRDLRQGGFAPPSIGRTNADGTFVIGGVIAGRYAVTANKLMRSGSGTTITSTMVSTGLVIGGSQPVQQVDVDGVDVTGLEVIVPASRQ